MTWKAVAFPALKLLEVLEPSDWWFPHVVHDVDGTQRSAEPLSFASKVSRNIQTGLIDRAGARVHEDVEVLGGCSHLDGCKVTD